MPIRESGRLRAVVRRMAGAISHENICCARRSARRPLRGRGLVRRHRCPHPSPGGRLSTRRVGSRPRGVDRGRAAVLPDLPQRPHADRQPLAGGFRRRHGGGRSGASRAHREDDPQAAGQHDAPAGDPPARGGNAHGPRRDARVGGGRSGRRESESRLPDLPAAEPVRVRAGRPRPAGTPDRCGRLPAARHDERQLRQHRRRPTAVGDAARRLPAGCDRGRPARRRQSERCAEADDLFEVAGLLAMGPGGGCTVRQPRRVLGAAQLPRRRGLPLHDGVPAHDHGRSVGIDHPQRADRNLDRRRARGPAGDGPVAAHLRPQRRVPGGRGADLRPGGTAAGFRGVRPAVRRARGRRAGPARVVDRRHRDRRPRVRHHRVAAHARLHHRRPVRRDRRVRNAQPAADLHLSSDLSRNRAPVRGGNRHPHRHARLPPAADRDGRRRPDGVLRGGPAR